MSERHYVVYSKSTGKVLRTISCPESAAVHQIFNSDEAIVETGDQLHPDQHIVDLSTGHPIVRRVVEH